MTLVIGVDESGTGAFAGPFMVTAVLIDHRFEETGKLLNDSKKLSDKKRRALVPAIREKAVGVWTHTVYPDQIKKHGQRQCWRIAIANVVAAARVCVHDLRNWAREQRMPWAEMLAWSVPIVIDGPRDRFVNLAWAHNGVVHNGLVTWEKQADGKYPAVMAASIIAKTERNDAMIALHARHPEYDWAVNAGYGVAKHKEAIAKHGLTEHHRPIKGIENL